MGVIKVAMVAPGEHPEGEAQGAKAAEVEPTTTEATQEEVTRLLKHSEHLNARNLIGVLVQTPPSATYYTPVIEELALEPPVGMGILRKNMCSKEDD